MAIEESLKFIEGKKTIYYAGIDHESLPNMSGKMFIKGLAPNIQSAGLEIFAIGTQSLQ